MWYFIIHNCQLLHSLANASSFCIEPGIGTYYHHWSFGCLWLFLRLISMYVFQK